MNIYQSDTESYNLDTESESGSENGSGIGDDNSDCKSSIVEPLIFDFVIENNNCPSYRDLIFEIIEYCYTFHHLLSENIIGQMFEIYGNYLLYTNQHVIYDNHMSNCKKNHENMSSNERIIFDKYVSKSMNGCKDMLLFAFAGYVIEARSFKCSEQFTAYKLYELFEISQKNLSFVNYYEIIDSIMKIKKMRKMLKFKKFYPIIVKDTLNNPVVFCVPCTKNTKMLKIKKFYPKIVKDTLNKPVVFCVPCSKNT